MNKSSIWGLVCGLAATALAFAYPRVFPTGVTLYDPARAYSSFVLFATAGDGPGQSYLIDMNGNEVHHWTRRGFPSVLLDPAVAAGARGHVLVQLSALDPPSGGAPARQENFRNKAIGELDWDGRGAASERQYVHQ